MKILIAVGGYWPSKGGVQMVTQYLAEGLVEKGHQVIVATQKHPSYSDSEIHNGVQIRRFSKKEFLKVPYGEKQAFQNFVIAESKDAHVLIAVCSNDFAARWLYPVIEQIPCRKIIYQHGMYDGKLHLDQCHSFYRFLKQLLLTPYWEIFHRYYWKQIKKFNTCIHLFKNDSSHNYFMRHGFANNHILLNSCQNAFFSAGASQHIAKKYNIEKPFFIYVANYCERKNQLLAVKAYVESICMHTDLVLIGSQKNAYYSKVADFLKKADGRKQAAVHLLVNVSREDTIQLIKESYACLLTSENEYMPITILECMASGKPFISTNVGVVSKIPGGNICMKEEDIRYWLEYYEAYPDYVAELGHIAAKFARQHCFLQDIIDEFEQVCKV